MKILSIVAAGVLVGGCTAHGPFDNGFIDPSEVGRFKKQPLLMPILSSLETGIEEPNEEFTNAQDVRPEDLVASAQDYVVGANDMLTISITDLVGPNVETLKQTRVSESGNVSLPLLGQIRAEGLTESQLEQEIIDAYRRNNIIQNAQVTVTVTEARARTFSILGQVQRAGQYQILQSDFRILDALVLAGDVPYQGIENIYVIRRENVGRGRSTTGPAGGATTLPSDELAPRSDAGGVGTARAVLLQTAGADALAPGAGATGTSATRGAATRPAPGGNLTAEERYGIVEGQPVLAPNRGTTTGTTGVGATGRVDPLAPSDARGTVGATGTAGARGTTGAMGATGTMGAGPTTQPAGTGGFEFNNPMGGENVRVIRVPLDELRNGDLKYNIVIRPQDMIIVPNPLTGEYWVAGHVQRGGVYSLTARRITLKEAVDGAGGFDAVAIPARTEVIRRIGRDKEVNVLVDLDKVYAGMQPDIYLKPYDHVRVGTNVFAPFIAALRNGFRVTYGFGFLYDRNYAPQQDQQR
ncbi:MAG TPA: polysaccharide biosynthesis/export family protein [Tepidisphaeraceae bacterium]